MLLRPTALAAAFVALAGCASYPAPTQRLADTESASRAATEVGAPASPRAQLHLTMAIEGIALAKRLMNDGDNRRADLVLSRAKADAELAVGLARETTAEAAAAQAVAQITALQNPTSSAASTTVTTSATTTTQTTGVSK